MNKKRIIMILALLIALLAMTACSKDDQKSENATTETTEAASESREIDFDAEGIATKFLETFMAESFPEMLVNFSYSDEMKEQFTVEAMETIHKQIVKAYGSFEGTYGLKTNEQAQYYIVSIGGNHVDKDLVYNVVFNYDGKIAGFNYQEISSVEDYFDAEIDNANEFEVTFGEAPFIIEGTLSIPKEGNGPFPVVVLVHGSGPNDRNESIYVNKPFKDIATGLIDKGVAVLRYDKRTYTHLEKFNDPTLAADFTIYDEVVDDAVYAVEFLKNYEGIDPKHIFVVGHSLGGNQAPRIADATEDVAGIAVLAGNVTPLQKLIVTQYKYLLGIDGTLDDNDQKQIESIENASNLISSDEMTLDTDMNLTMGLSPKYWMDIKDYNPVELAATLNIPILVLQGSRDYQVTVDEFKLWQEGLGDKADYKEYSDLNHLFMTGEGMSKPEEYTVAAHVSSEMINDLADWVLTNSK